MKIRGWVELDGQVLSGSEIEEMFARGGNEISRFGGEFFIEWDGCRARDQFGIIQGNCPAGTCVCGEKEPTLIRPEVSALSLHEAILKAVSLRATEGITALSGGVDSALVAALAGRPCLCVGVADSHDLRRAEKVAGELHLPLESRIVTPAEIEEALRIVSGLIKDPTPVDISIATTLFFVAEMARELGYERILTGQGADEVFGGYSRYLGRSAEELRETFAADFADLPRQGLRDQTIAGYHDTWLSMPYLDIRVVCAASAIPPDEKVRDGIRKRPLREVAACYLPKETAYYDKKAMQYGTGIWKEIKRLARKNGYQNSVSDYLHNIRSE